MASYLAQLPEILRLLLRAARFRGSALRRTPRYVDAGALSVLPHGFRRSPPPNAGNVLNPGPQKPLRNFADVIFWVRSGDASKGLQSGFICSGAHVDVGKFEMTSRHMYTLYIYTHMCRDLCRQAILNVEQA